MIAASVPLAAGVLMGLLATWLTRVASDNRAARAFAVVLTSRGAALAVLSGVGLAGSLEAVRGFMTAYIALELAALFAVGYFASVYPRPRAWLPPGPAGPIAFLAVLLVVEIPLFLDPDLARPLAALDGPGLSLTVPSVLAARQGPYGGAQTMLDLAMAILAAVFSREYFASPPGRRRGTLLLVSLGFFAPAACSCLMAAAGLMLTGAVPQPSDPSVFNYIEMGMFGAWALLLIGLMASLGLAARRVEDPEQRRHMAVFVLVLIVSMAMGATVALLPPPASFQGIFVMLGGWSALGALLVTYGVLRHRLFDIDLRVKATLRRGTVAAAFVAAYFVVSEGSAQLLSDFSGSAYLGIGAAALLLFALQPLKRMAETLVREAMPGTKPLGELDDDEALAFYRENVELMWMDGTLSTKDRLVLGNLRRRLGLSPERAEEIELEVVAGRLS